MRATTKRISNSEGKQMTTYRILSIDAWRYPEGWRWNNWFNVGSIDSAEFESVANDNRKLLAYMRDAGFLSDSSKGRVAVDDDGYNVVILSKSTRQPLFAIEYGAEG